MAAAGATGLGAAHGRAVLEPLGLAASECALLLDSWSKLRNRRHRVSTEAAGD